MLDDRAARQPRSGKAAVVCQGRDESPAGARRRNGPRAAAALALGRTTAPDQQPGRAGAGGLPDKQATPMRKWNARLELAHSARGKFPMLRGLPAHLPATCTPWERLLCAQGWLSTSRRSQRFHGRGQRVPTSPMTVEPIRAGVGSGSLGAAPPSGAARGGGGGRVGVVRCRPGAGLAPGWWCAGGALVARWLRTSRKQSRLSPGALRPLYGWPSAITACAECKVSSTVEISVKSVSEAAATPISRRCCKRHSATGAMPRCC